MAFFAPTAKPRPAPKKAGGTRGACYGRPMAPRPSWASLGIVALLLVACGGSSSETPPPLEPDPEGFRYAGRKASRPAEPEPSADGEDEKDDGEPERSPSRPRGRGDAQPTWGNSDGRPAAPK